MQGGSVMTSITTLLVDSMVTCLTSLYGISLQYQPARQVIPTGEFRLVGGVLAGKVQRRKHHLHFC